MTADLPTLVASRSIFAPSSADSAVGSRSSNSTTFPTRYGNCLQNISDLNCDNNPLTKQLDLPVIFDLFEIILNLLPHCSLLM